MVPVAPHLVATRPLLWFVLLCVGVSCAVLGVLAARRRAGVGVLWLWVGAVTMLMWIGSGRPWPLRGPSGQPLYLGSGVIAPSLLLLLLLVYLEHGARDARRVLGAIIGTGVLFQLCNMLADGAGAPLAPVTWLHVLGSAASQAAALGVMSVCYQTVVHRRLRIPLVALVWLTLIAGTAVDLVIFAAVSSAGFGVIDRLGDPQFVLSKLVGTVALSLPAVVYLRRQLRLGRPLAVQEMSPLAIAGLGREGPVPDVLAWRAMAETLGDGLTISTEGHVLFANGAMARMMGEDPRDLRNVPFERIIAPEDVARVRLLQWERLAGLRGAESLTWRLVRADGVRRTISTTSTPVLLGGTRVTVGLHRDVTDELETRSQLEATTEALQALVASTAELVASFDPAVVVPALVERARRLVDARGVAYLERIDGDDRLACRHVLGRCGRLPTDGTPVRESRLRTSGAFDGNHVIGLRAGGRDYGLLLVSPRAEQGAFAWHQRALLESLGAIGGAALHTAELLRGLRAAEARWAALFDQVPAPVWLYDPPTGRILAANAAALRRYGWSREELLGMTLPDLAADADRPTVGAGTETVAAAGDPPLLVRHRDREGAEFDVLFSRTPVDLGGERLGLAACVDVTAERRNQERLQTSRRLESLGRLAGGIAHDFNNILTAVQMDLEMLEDDSRDRPDTLAELANIRAAVERAADLTRQVLLFSRGEEAKRRPVALNDVVREVERLLRRSLGAGVELVVALDPDAPVVEADPSQLHSALLNLCVNARDAMPRGGEVTITTGRAALGDAAAARLGLTPGPTASVTVTDDGVGMPPDVLARALEPFFTTKEPGKGTGLGLSLVHGVARAHGGAVELVSSPERGTSVTLHLPVWSGRPAEAPEPPHGSLRGAETVLLVDDESAIRRAGARLLARYGYRVVVAEDGEDAVRRLEAAGGEIDLVVTDMVMPRMDARDLLGVVRERWPALPVLLSTGYDAGRLGDGDLALFDGFVAKPYSQDELLSVIRRTLDAGL